MHLFEKINTATLLKSLGISIGFGIAGGTVILFLFAVLMALSGLPLDSAVYLSMLALWCMTLISGFSASVMIKVRGLLVGAISGGVFVIVWLLISILFGTIEWSVLCLVKGLGCIVFGAIGGIIGINRKQQRIRY